MRVPGERLGGLTPAAAAEFGLSPGIAVATSMIDAHAGALGTLGASGDAAPISKRMAIIAGTSACHLATCRPERSRARRVGTVLRSAVAERWLLEAGISASGAFLDHVLRSHPAYESRPHTFAALEQRLTDLLGRGATVQELTTICICNRTCSAIAHRWPIRRLRGGVSGWTLREDATISRGGIWRHFRRSHTRPGTSSMRSPSAGRVVDLLIASGGSALNPRWCQTHADALGIPIAVPHEADGVLLGSAILGSTAAGVHASLDVAMQAMTRLGRIVQPIRPPPISTIANTACIDA